MINLQFYVFVITTFANTYAKDFYALVYSLDRKTQTGPFSINGKCHSVWIGFVADNTGLSFRATLPLFCQHFWQKIFDLSSNAAVITDTVIIFLMSTGRYLVAAGRLFFFVFHSEVLILCPALMFQGPFRLRGMKDCSDLLAMLLNGLSVWIQAHISIFSQWRCIQPIWTCIGWSAPLCDALRHVTLQPCSHCVPPLSAAAASSFRQSPGGWAPPAPLRNSSHQRLNHLGRNLLQKSAS